MGHALENAAPNLDDGPYPLVIYSHGFGNQRLGSLYLVEHLASYGFVVMAVDHEDNPGVQPAPMYRSQISRTDDITREIDYAEWLTSEDGDLTGLIDMENIGVTGHSFGGFASLIAANGQLDWDNFEAICEDDPDPLGTCPNLLGNLETMATLAGWDEVPDSPWPSRGDSRIDAIAPLAPAGRFVGPNGAKGIDVPVLMMVGTADNIATPQVNFYDVYDSIETPKAMVQLEAAGHFVFGLGCESTPWMVAGGFYWACSDPVWDMDRVHDLTDHFVTAFFLTELYGDEAAAEALAPENVAFRGIVYDSTLGE